MKRVFALILSLVCMLSLAGCDPTEAEQQTAPPITQIGNPWSGRSSIQEAEAVTGFPFGLPDVIADRYTADQIRTMNNSLIEVIYRHGEAEVCVRKQPGEGQDISGDYNHYETCTETTCNGGAVTAFHNPDTGAVKQLVSYQGYSWSLVAPNGFPDDSGEAFLREICK